MTMIKNAETSLSEQENPIVTGPIWRQLLYFFFPILFGSFFQQMYNTVDAIIVGQFVGTAALAAVGGTTSVLISFLVNLFTGISSGATVIIAQLYGAQRYDDVRKTVHTAMSLTLIAGLAITVIGYALSRPALVLMGTPTDTLEYAVTYMQIYFLGSIASFLYNIGSGILRAVGDSKRPLYFLIAACVTNIVLDIALVVGLNMGVTGVALATVASQVVSAVLVIITLMKTKEAHRVDWKALTLEIQPLKDILRVGIPTGLQSNMYAISNIFLQASINSFGTVAAAAWTAYSKVDSFWWMVIGAFGIAITNFVGQNYGAGKYDRVRKSVRTCLIMSFSSAIAIGLIFCLFAEPLLSLFSNDAGVIQQGMRIAYLTAPFYICFVCIEILSGAIRGTGNSFIPMVLTCLGVCVLRLAWVFFLLPYCHEFDMIAISYPVSWTICSLMFVFYYLKGNWMKGQ